MKRSASASVTILFALLVGRVHAQTGGTNQEGNSGGGSTDGQSSKLDANRGNKPSELPNMLKNGMGNAQAPGLPGDSPSDIGRKLVNQ